MNKIIKKIEEEGFKELKNKEKIRIMNFNEIIEIYSYKDSNWRIYVK